MGRDRLAQGEVAGQHAVRGGQAAQVSARDEARRNGADEAAAEAAVRRTEATIREIVAAPERTDRMWEGHTWRRWATFAGHSAVDDLLASRARLFCAHGTHDRSVPIESFDYLAARLLAAGRDAELRRYPGRDHSFIEVGTEPGYEGILAVVDEVLVWAAGPRLP